MYKTLPNLRFISIDKLFNHEAYDEIQVQRLLDQIKRDGCLRNPIIVAQLPSSDKILVLDGVSRINALKEIGCRDVIVQKVDYTNPLIHLDSFCWVIESVSRPQVENRLSALGFFGIPSSPEEGIRKIANNQAVLYFLFKDGSGLHVPLKTDILYERIEALRLITESFNNIFENHIIDQPVDYSMLFNRFDKGNVLSVFPKFTKEDVLYAAENGFHLPFGVTTFSIPDRVLGLSIPLSVLISKDPVTEKDSYLLELLKIRLSKHRARYYSESVVILND
ncbi:MAG: ParB N-terminal domain-containing protein [candidate division Zixibacteria bacterium]|nr:ParB N-terminal domain-containing protein [candidate division Zixibacteria bacterium]